MLAELSTKEISEVVDPETFDSHKNVAQQGGEIVRNARLELEAKTGKRVMLPLNAKDGILFKKDNRENDESDTTTHQSFFKSKTPNFILLGVKLSTIPLFLFSQ